MSARSTKWGFAVPTENKDNLKNLAKMLQASFSDLLATLQDEPQVMIKMRSDRNPYILIQKAAALAEDLDRLIWVVYKEDCNEK